jgi:Flp pilus assembly pilin Flp
MLKRLFVEDAGQDLIEYALLATIIGIAGVLIWPAIETALATNYWSGEAGAYSISVPLNPASP